MVFDFVDEAKLNKIVTQVLVDSDLSRDMLIRAGRLLETYAMQKQNYDEAMESMQRILKLCHIEYDIEQENIPEGNGNDLYIYSQETLNEMFANDQEEEVRAFYGN